MTSKNISVFVRKPRWIFFHALCLTGVVIMVNLSLWQFQRMNERREFNDLVKERTTQPVVALDDVNASVPSDIVWRRIGAVGTYAVDEQVLILNRGQGGRAGVNIATPLVLENGRAIMVVRGFVPLNEVIPDPPSGQVRVVGTVRASEERRTGQPTEATGEVTELFRLDLERLAAQIVPELLPIALNLEISDPAENPNVQPVAKPELSDGPHLSYGVQWLIFAFAVVIGWFLAVRRSYSNLSRSGRPTSTG